MKCITLLFAALFSFGCNAHAQIYADVTVSHGANALGTFRIQLHHDVTPRTVANFIGLATGERNWIDPSTGTIQTNKPYYDGLTFHRLIHTFMIQGGDPLGTGFGGPGYGFRDEFDLSLSHDEYVISMANSGPSSNGSQFFITLSAQYSLNDTHSVFGEVIDDATYPNSRALIDGFKSSANFPTDGSNLPTTPITIDSVIISGPDFAAFDINAWNLPTVEPVAIDSIDVNTTTDDYSIDISRSTFSVYAVSHSSDLQTWTPFSADTLAHTDTTPASTLDVSEVSTGEPNQFYQAAVTHYASAPSGLKGLTIDLTLTSSIPSQTLSLSFTRNERSDNIPNYNNPRGTYTVGNSSGLIGLYYWDLLMPSSVLVIATEPLGDFTFFLTFHPDGTGTFTGQDYLGGSTYPYFGNFTWQTTP